MFKNQFPIFQNEKINYLDTAASAQKPRLVIDEIADFYQNQYANVHRGSCHLASMATSAYEEARKTVAQFINASEKQVVFTTCFLYFLGLFKKHCSKLCEAAGLGFIKLGLEICFHRAKRGQLFRAESEDILIGGKETGILARFQRAVVFLL